MLNTNTSYLDGYKATSRELEGKIICGANQEISHATNLKSFKIDKTSPQGKFFGFAVSQMITIEAIGIVSVNKGDKIEVQVGLKSEESHIDLPYFYVDEINYNKVENKTTITGYDIIGSNRDKLIGDLVFTYPTTLQAYATKIASSIGATVEWSGYTFRLTEPPNFDGSENIQTVLTGIAEVAGAICYVRKGNVIKFRVLSSSIDDTITANEYFSFSNGDAIELTEIASKTELGDNTVYGSEGFTQVMYENPFLNLRDDVASIINGMQSNVISLVNVPYSLDWRGCPAYEMGDHIKITEKDSVDKYVYYLNETLTYNGGLSAKSDWESVESGNVDGVSSLKQFMGKTEAKVDKVNRQITLLVEEQAEINGEITTLRSEFNQTAQGFEQYVEDEVNGLRSEVNQSVSGFEQLVEDEVNGLRSEVNQSVSNINQTITNTKRELESEISQTESSITSTISKQNQTISEIKQDLDGISLTYNSSNGTASITIGDITVSNLVNGQYVEEQVAGIDLDGYVRFNDLSTSGSTTINGSNITTGTISADRINLTGEITWSDLSSGCRNTIQGLVSEPDLPSYIKSTYIDSTTIQSPSIVGGSVSSTYGNKNATLYNSKLEFKSDNSTVGYIQAYDDGAGTVESARTGIRIKGSWNGSGYNGGVKIESGGVAAIALSSGKDIYFYINNGEDVISVGQIINQLESGGGGGGTATAVFG